MENNLQGFSCISKFKLPWCDKLKFTANKLIPTLTENGDKGAVVCISKSSHPKVFC